MSDAAMHDPTAAIFESAVQEFRKNLKDEKVYKEILETKSIDDIYDATDALQKEQGRDGHLRHLSKIRPFLDGMQEYTDVIEQFLQVKPEVIALIWGPVKLLIQWTSALARTFDAIRDTIADIGAALPKFKSIASSFGQNGCIKDILLLFFKDILDFYAVTLKFFSSSRWRYVFESLWPAQRKRIDLVIGHIRSHVYLMRDEVQFEHIRREEETRVRAIQHHELVERHCRHQEYQSLRTVISPVSFGGELDRLRSRTYPGTWDWLMKLTSFTKWLDPTDSTERILWQYGIPGAGKTFLSCQAVCCAERKCPTAFAFLSYTQEKTITALTVVHSLVFQLASYDEQLQDVLREAGYRNMQYSLIGAKQVLADILKCVGMAFIILDGIDEIESNESRRLVTTLLEISTEAKGVKLLLSGRPEDAISRMLKSYSSIRVDENNLESIQAFVTQRSESWLQEFSPDAAREIRGLLKPLAAKSKGMFLYASIVLNSIRSLELDEIKADLAVLPEHLDDLYGRIIKRINTIPSSSARNKVYKILGWTACTPQPLTVQELEQALLIGPGDFERNERITRRLNVVDLCGPVVEVIDGDYIVLVHFTFKEYLLDRILRREDAILGLAQCCVTYLGRSHHNIDQSNQEVSQNILVGHYRLHHYAVATWLDIVRKYFQLCSTNPSTELVNQLCHLQDVRCSKYFEAEQILRPSSSFRCLKSSNPSLYDWLCSVEQSQRNVFKLDLQTSEGTHRKLDPTTISIISQRLHAVLDLLLCRNVVHRDCQCVVVQRHLGRRLFRCSFIGCEHYRHGFELYRQRFEHLRTHISPWKCTHVDCERDPPAFPSKKALEQHTSLTHPQALSSLCDFPKITEIDDLKDLIYDLIAMNRISEVTKILEGWQDDASQIQQILTDKHRAVPTNATCKMLDVIINWLCKCPWPDVTSNNEAFSRLLSSSITNDNSQAFRYLIRHDRYATIPNRGLTEAHLSTILKFDKASFIDDMCKLAEERLFEIPSLKATEDVRAPFTRRFRRWILNRMEAFFPWCSFDVLEVAITTDMSAQSLVSWWRALDIFALVPEDYLYEFACWLTFWYPRRELLEFLISQGLPVDHPKYNTSLLFEAAGSAASTSARVAEVVAYLLAQGSDPKLKRRTRSLSAYRCTKNISKWTGKTLEEMIKETEPARQRLKAQTSQ